MTLRYWRACRSSKAWRPIILRLLAFSAVRLEIPAGSVLFEKGASAKSGYIVARGLIQLVEGDGADRRVVADCPEGTLIGETALFVETIRPATAIAMTDAQVIDLGRAGVTRMVREYPEVAVALHARLARRLSGTMGDLAAIGSTLAPVEGPPRSLPDAG